VSVAAFGYVGLRAKAAAEGQRQPVQVVEGNYQVGVGPCAGWDGVRRGQ